MKSDYINYDSQTEEFLSLKVGIRNRNILVANFKDVKSIENNSMKFNGNMLITNSFR